MVLKDELGRQTTAKFQMVYKTGDDEDFNRKYEVVKQELLKFEHQNPQFCKRTIYDQRIQENKKLGMTRMAFRFVRAGYIHFIAEDTQPKNQERGK